MSTELITVDPCTHPELNMKPDLLDNRIYWCSACRKKIIIPMYQLTLSGKEAQENFGNMIALAFGECWGKLAREGRV